MRVAPQLFSETANTDADVRLREFAHQLAKAHILETSRAPNPPLAEYLRTWEKALRDVNVIFKAMPSKDLAGSRAREWTLDNFYLVTQTFRQIDENLPARFYNQLPKLNGTPAKGYPRILALAREWINYCQSQVDLDQTTAYVQAYQQVAPLTIGEIWALPIMLRIGVLEKLVSASTEIAGIETPKCLSEIASQVPPPPAANETLVASSFISLRLLSVIDWKAFFEQTSRVEQVLRDDPAGIYADMDFDTRNSYRSGIEELAYHSRFSEEEVAHAVIELACGADVKVSGRQAHVGYYLQDKGRVILENKLGYRPGPGTRIRSALLASPTLPYLGSIITLSILIIAGLLTYTFLSGGSLTHLIIVGVLGVGLALEFAIIIVNGNVTRHIKPQRLPRMDFSEGVPPGNRTMVVFPVLLESGKELNHLLQELELVYLSNSDPQLTFALLTDYSDAPKEDMPEDGKLLALAREGVENLNKKYADSVPFYLFHRKRQWNPSEGVWMGWERKRGKLADFNHLLLNLKEPAYTSQVGDASILPDVKYVITLDADTFLPSGSANQLIATLAHPLNQAEFSADGRSVVAGYTVLQPRVAVKPTSANRSRFSQIFAGIAGFDLYSFAVSDVYQDLFGEGSYVGKGIYDVKAFERSLAGQVRQNTLLSHDLFEGIYGRAALVTDIVLYEDYPSRYLVYVHRLHRWIRGDWQLLPWLFPIVRTQNGLARNRLSAINLWKIFDNLRRSLLPPTLLALLAASWLWLPGSPLVWTVLALLPSALPFVMKIVQPGQPGNRRRTLNQLLEPIRLPLFRWALAILFLANDAFMMLGAIGTTLMRLLIKRKNLLEWTTAAQTARQARLNSRYEAWVEMAPSQVFSLLLGIATVLFNPAALWVAAPLLVAWIIAPQIAYMISKPLTHDHKPLLEPQHREVLRLARRTWAFFERFVGPDDHWLPPDHYQEAPHVNVAHYTTPTNIGLFLLSTLAAYDFGFLDLSDLSVRLRSTLESVDSLEHYRGHLLNWYDTHTLGSLEPRYVSTVDSGNLAACLITLKQGCLGLKNAPVLGNKQWQGLLVILDILSEMLQTLEKNQAEKPVPGGGPRVNIESFKTELAGIYERVSTIQDQPAAWTSTLAWLLGEGMQRVSQHLMELLDSHPNLSSETLTDLQLHFDLLHQHLEDMQRGMNLFIPWHNRLDAAILKTAAGQDFLKSLPVEIPTLGQAAALYDLIQRNLNHFKAQVQDEAGHEWCQKLLDDLAWAGVTVTSLLTDFRELAEHVNAIVTCMDFRFLFDGRRQVFRIGYHVSNEQYDPNDYDLLASEARIASLIAIAKGDVPQSHWQHLGRPVTMVNGRQVLLSWGGTMFEYLMPTLLVRNYTGTFLSDSCYSALEAQAGYGQKKGVPWGISESGYYAFDLNLNYQYRSFGVPSLGYKRDLANDLVIAPYASLLGLSMLPQAVLRNMEVLEHLGMLGRFGFYEALDFTKTRLPVGQTHAIVQSYMAHHQGMILLAACNYLSDDGMVKRFHSDVQIRSMELLLQELIPQNPLFEYPHSDEPVALPGMIAQVESSAWRVPVDSPIPQVHVLSNGDASTLITNAGGGFSQWRQLALTRWHADSTLDSWGTWIYVQDLESGALWSATTQPIGSASEQPDILFYPHMVEFMRSDDGISLRTGITVSTDGVEIRRVIILNNTDLPRQLKLTSYGEVVLAEQADDRRHPAFNKLFIESEYLPQEKALLFQRRPRSRDEKPVVLVHAMITEAGNIQAVEYESDRLKFLGRSQTMRTPQALEDVNHHLSGTTGGTLDPIFSLAQEIDLEPHTKTRITFLTLAAPSRHEVLEKLSRYQTGQAINLAFEVARTSSEGELLEIGLNSYAVENIQRLLSALLYPVGILRAAPHLLAQNGKGQSGLWAFGISGDYPILLLHIRDGESSLLSEALQAFTYWRKHHITVNLVILNDQDTGYALDLHNTILRQAREMGTEGLLNQRDGIFVLRTDQIQPADTILLETVAGVIMDEKAGTLAEHAIRLTALPTRLPGFTPAPLPFGNLTAAQHDRHTTPPLQLPSDLLMDNDLGGFSRDGREYVIHLRPGQHTPHPWVNVIANPQFGFMVSEAGAGSTWAENSSENRLTPWRNDPVVDMPGEALYLRDEETGLVWTPTPMPAGEESAHIIRHGAGYSVFESQTHGLNQNLRLFAAPDAPVKIVHLRLSNLWEHARRITVTYFAEWVLGTTRDTYQAHILPEFDPERHALLATNRYNSEFSERVAFLAANKKPHGVTTDRTEFLGRLGSLRNPAALGRIGLASAVNAGLDPCAAIQLHVDLAPGGVEEVFFLIGEGANRADSLDLIQKIQAPGQVEATWQAVKHQWDEILNAVTVETPDPGMNMMLNRWLLYQTLSGRVWGRTGLYQSSGAFGFRDQLQDVLALLHTRPGIARAQILEAARHQFEAGDVLHWWNPPAGRGVRTRFSDDLLWLPFVTAEYVSATGDRTILAENVPFLKGDPLRPEETERYGLFESTQAAYSLYQHCRRALEKGSTAGVHGLPLMGAGDWNDGMNRVGAKGQGESVWLGWFLYATLMRFAPLIRLAADDPAPTLQQAEKLSRALAASAWDGDWYLRAFYDDGSRLGSRENTECRIDSIAQSWAVLSKAADPARAAQAMEAVNRLLVKPDEQMILLFTPPFDGTGSDPGYIKGYLPGVRENGGQYTHAGIWAAWANAELGQGERAGELFHLLNPIYHADTPEKAARYMVEPYVIAADIYSEPAHAGAGGWTWYTGSAGWMYRLGLEAILGVSRAGDALILNPCIPGNWPGFQITYRFGSASYRIRVENPQGVSRGVSQAWLDGLPLPEARIAMTDDGKAHEIRLIMGTVFTQ